MEVHNGRTASRLAALEKELGSAFLGVVGDATNESVLESLFTRANEHFSKPVDLVVANAGRGLGGTVKDVDMTEFMDTLNINVTGALALLQKAAQKMVDTQQDSYPDSPADIVVIGSVAGRHISPFSAAYGASKFAVHALTEGLRREVGPRGVRVSLIEPGIVLSGFQAGAGYSDALVQQFKNNFGPLLTGDDVANTIHYIVTQPPHVHIGDIVIRPTRQDYP